MFNIIVGAGAASRYGSGSDQKMRLWLRNKKFYLISLKLIKICGTSRLFFIKACK
jgi:hypothetical protein